MLLPELDTMRESVQEKNWAGGEAEQLIRKSCVPVRWLRRKFDTFDTLAFTKSGASKDSLPNE